MIPAKIAHAAFITPKLAPLAPKIATSSSFSDILASKTQSSLPHKIFDNLVSNHEGVAKAMHASMTRTSYTPEKLLNKQYNIGMLLLREQIYTKSVELSANTLKNFTQMQV